MNNLLYYQKMNQVTQNCLILLKTIVNIQIIQQMIRHNSAAQTAQNGDKQTNGREMDLMLEYVKQLQAQNKAKGKQIVELTKQLHSALNRLDELELKARNSFNSGYHSSTVCFKCADKQKIILNKNNQIKIAEGIIAKYEKTIRQNQSLINQRQAKVVDFEAKLKEEKSKNEKQTTQNVPQKDSQLTIIRNQNTRIKKQLQNLKREQTNPQFVISGNTNNPSNQQETLKTENLSLREKIQYLQKRIFVVQDSNTILKEEILKHLNYSKIIKPTSSQSQYLNNSKPISSQNKYLNNSKIVKPTSSSYKPLNDQKIIKPTSSQIKPSNDLKPTISQNRVQFIHDDSLQHNASAYAIDGGYESCCRHKPQENKHSWFSTQSNNHLQQTNCENPKPNPSYNYLKEKSRSEYLAGCISPLSALKNQSSKPVSYHQKNLVSEHLRNLRRKIKILRGENQRLRDEVNCITIQ